ncbi:hypothetical protein PHPALM_31916 [Phytophthora palmivora]|uniref:MULE transposase domain-containing protein n=1 Tax=Phytophthora palmivora TaxID=4796 RepID=A0A2P4X1F6_9STRA|nr:hypothetical protein PHPALM_31916 [Phytophthora palmivora]
MPSKIWELIREQFTSARMVHGLTRDQVISRVYRTRNRHFGSTIYGRVEVPPLSLTKACDATFFQFYYTYVDGGEVQHIFGWGHPALIRLLSYNQTALYIDGTFHCVPTPFYQCIVVMVHDRGSKCFVPCMYCLTTNKSEWTYWHTLHCVQATTGITMDVGTVSCDFERGLINAVGDQFPEANIIGCLFHFMQAVRRKIQKLHIPGEEVTGMMLRGFLDSLIVIPHDRIDPHGINYVIEKFKSALRKRGTEYSHAKWVEFWAYFRKTW